MRRAATAIALLIPALLFAGALAAPPVPAQAQELVSITDAGFILSSTSIVIGDSILWTNDGTTAHTTTSDTALWDSGSLALTTGAFVRTFSVAGSFPYHCTIHPGLTGTIVVVDPATATTTSTTTRTPTVTRTPTATSTVTRTPTRTATVTATPLGRNGYFPIVQVPVPPVHIVYSRMNYLEGGLNVVGEIINTTDQPVDNATITATFNDEVGKPVITLKEVSPILRTGSGERTPFDIYLPNDSGVNDRIVSYVLHLQTQPMGAGAYQRLEIVSPSAKVNASGYAQVTGFVRNNTEKIANDLRIGITFYGSNGQVIDAGSVDMSDEAPLDLGGLRYFGYVFSLRNPNFTSAAVIVEATLTEPPPVPDPKSPCNINVPAPAEGAQAWMTRRFPSQLSDTTVCARLIRDGKVVRAITMEARAHYKTKDTYLGTVDVGSDGVAHRTFNVGGATEGYTVVVDVTIGGEKTTTSFTPY